VNPFHMYGSYDAPPRYMWYLATNQSTRSAQYLPTVVKLDTLSNTTRSWWRPHFAPVSPIMVRETPPSFLFLFLFFLGGMRRGVPSAPARRL
jgi:hypothetical protein